MVDGPFCPMTKATNKAALKEYGSNIRVVKARLAFAFFNVVPVPIRWPSAGRLP